MTEQFNWVERGERLHSYVCVSEAESWDALTPALVAAWVQFAEVLSTRVALDLRTEVRIAFFPSSGRLVFNHAKRDYPADMNWADIPTDYIWSVTLRCGWIEDLWEDSPEKTGVAFASACLRAATAEKVHLAFRDVGLDTLPVRGAGVTQSPAPFETTLPELFRGRIPTVTPAK